MCFFIFKNQFKSVKRNVSESISVDFRVVKVFNIVIFIFEIMEGLRILEIQGSIIKDFEVFV